MADAGDSFVGRIVRPIPALTLHQPWASLVAIGAKTIETRSWSTSYRGPLAIHAGASIPAYARAALAPRPGVGRQSPISEALRGAGLRFQWDRRRLVHALPLGAVVATATLVDVVRMVSWCSLDGPAAWAAHMIPDEHADPGTERCLLLRDAQVAAEAIRIDGPLPAEIDATDQLPFGDFRPGRFAWLLADVTPVTPPVPAKGHQQLWPWTPSDSGSDRGSS